MTNGTWPVVAYAQVTVLWPKNPLACDWLRPLLRELLATCVLRPVLLYASPLSINPLLAAMLPAAAATPAAAAAAASAQQQHEQQAQGISRGQTGDASGSRAPAEGGGNSAGSSSSGQQQVGVNVAGGKKARQQQQQEQQQQRRASGSGSGGAPSAEATAVAAGAAAAVAAAAAAVTGAAAAGAAVNTMEFERRMADNAAAEAALLLRVSKWVKRGEAISCHLCPGHVWHQLVLAGHAGMREAPLRLAEHTGPCLLISLSLFAPCCPPFLQRAPQVLPAPAAPAAGGCRPCSFTPHTGRCIPAR